MPKFFNNSTVSGFTLVEIMLTVGIIVILTLAVLPSVGNFADSNLLNQSLQNIASDMENAKFKALSGSYDGTNSAYWGFTCDASNDKYYLISVDPTNFTNTLSTRTQMLPTNVTISCTNVPIIFKRLSGSLVSASNPIITVTKGSLNGTITVSQQGIISINRY